MGFLKSRQEEIGNWPKAADWLSATSVQSEVLSGRNAAFTGPNLKNFVRCLSHLPAELDPQVTLHELRNMALRTDYEPSFAAALKPHTPDPHCIPPATSHTVIRYAYGTDTARAIR